MDFDVQDSLNHYAGQNIAIGQIAAYRQRTEQLEQQRRQLGLLEEQNRIEQSRTALEQRRLQIEELRFQAEQQERELKREQTEQVKLLRNLLADTAALLRSLQKQHP